jgi:uncharacterized protein YdiU (UPF0061 family)
MNVLAFDNRFVRELPADPSEVNRPRQVHGACYSKVAPTPVAQPRLIACAREVLQAIGLSEEDCNSEEFVATFAGNRLAPGMIPYAACYGGHQFGSWAGQLGDGRAIALGEVIGPGGARWELQLKGAGRTPYSRTADGRAVMRSSVREFLCSEAMHHLGVPTTRALSLIATGEQVLRDMLYDGNPRLEPGAIVCRAAPSFIRFGNFELLTARRDLELLRKLADHTIRGHFPELCAAGEQSGGEIGKETYVRWFAEICQRTARMIVHWMRVGFVHGVMNTDNMSILGLTIDYGPYGWLEGFDPGWTPNTTDAQGRRYRYGAQPEIGMWNLVCLANALLPLVADVPALEQALEGYRETFTGQHRAMLASKLGLSALAARGSLDETLIEDLPRALHAAEIDMTIFFRALADLPVSSGPSSDADLLLPLAEAFYQPAADPMALPAAARATITGWLRRYVEAARASGVSDPARRQAMNAVNPRYVLRNYLAQLAIDEAEKGDPGKVRELLDVLRRPYDDQPGREEFARRRPEWARDRVGCSMLSCSS